MKKTLFLLVIFLSFSHCKSSKGKRASSSKIITKKSEYNSASAKKSKDKKLSNKRTRSSSKTDQIIDYAKQFNGVRYKWGGTTKSGMDCSGLVYQSFKAHDIILPRISRDMAKKGQSVALKNVKTGDLLFFVTKHKGNSINHVGLIVAIKNNDIKFIHATTSKGVITSGLNETYWLKAFKHARRIL